ncbi:DUF2812 domain-containing protein [Psychrobacillus glaciei]|uniref:DUF2812 domain-containing protein n=1 Tax=Psychrobacillus glaciei TaxID=2283160 RepID=A0A5J6SMY3_9BACI|nr:DUF2812 domain-containing protein [Psychrobacillus glaciei]QFF99380.1 DUF2812 domain-containing protein [Psychrobacillus glaciei]
MIKRWRPFWSFDVEKTECWLSSNESNGKRLVDVKLFSRVFVFEETDTKQLEYQIIFDKSKNSLPSGLVDSGWEDSLVKGNWKFVRNGRETIRAYPSREGIMKRNRVHLLLMTVLSYLYVIQLFSFIIGMLTAFFAPGKGNLVASPLWSLTILYFIQVIGVIIFTFYMTRKLRAFQRKFFSSVVVKGESNEGTFSKWRFGWVYAPDLLENWLSKMAEEGNHLVRVNKNWSAFIFEKDTPKLVSYVQDFQWKRDPEYFDFHKNAGWTLRFTSPSWLINYSIWEKEYTSREMKPRFTYNSTEMKAQVRKVIIASSILISYLLAIWLFAIWIQFSNNQAFDINLIPIIINGLLIISLISPIFILIRTFLYALRMRKSI